MRKWTPLTFVVNLVQAFVLTLIGILSVFVPRRFRSKSVTGEVALVTGAGSGIGRLMAILLAREGCHVICWDVNRKGNDETVAAIQRLKGQAHGFVVDVTKREMVYEMAAKIPEVTEGREVTILINNAGIVIGEHLENASDEKIKLLMDVNTVSHFWTVKAFLPGMTRAKKGHIITIASSAGLIAATDRMVPYFTSKFAAVGFDEALYLELQFTNRSYIKTTVVCPFFINTGMFDGAASILPILEPGYVAEQVIAAMKANEEVLILPGWVWIFPIIKALVPRKVSRALCRAFAFDEGMSNFRGRNPAESADKKST
ncbi:unnamed protein product [Cyprideis torosa]|uniref:Short-chain dehydrogenase/reductase 3 n=1 Tax=Cyprideis torosa TaxID=163714 RepID=A0A7R8WFJ6_9CRUS|nr:unnamed protein product [Cyprideis torosa]CAG0894226.1 unnamed protein product [Cyprideis torosa]